jgi:hypothetical protein
MNIFYLHKDPKTCAQLHCDKHVVKMIIEYAQLLSTAHRVLDGKEYEGRTKTGRKAKRWLLEDWREDTLYMASHIKHPDELWIQKSKDHYDWTYQLFYHLCDEYTHRYGRVHETDRKLRDALANAPNNLQSTGFVDPPQCMPEYCKTSSALQAYHNYYIKEKVSFAKWTKREIPNWFVTANVA